MLGNHGLITILFCHLAAEFHKDRKQVTLAVGIGLFDIFRQFGAHARAAHIGRVGDHHIVFLGQHFGHLDQGQQLGQGCIPLHVGVLLLQLGKSGI